MGLNMKCSSFSKSSVNFVNEMIKLPVVLEWSSGTNPIKPYRKWWFLIGLQKQRESNYEFTTAKIPLFKISRRAQLNARNEMTNSNSSYYIWGSCQNFGEQKYFSWSNKLLNNSLVRSAFFTGIWVIKIDGWNRNDFRA